MPTDKNWMSAEWWNDKISQQQENRREAASEQRVTVLVTGPNPVTDEGGRPHAAGTTFQLRLSLAQKMAASGYVSLV